MLNFISQYTSIVLTIAFYGPVALSLVYNFPTYMVWLLSNLLQIIEIFSYLRINLPGNVIQIQSGFIDFIHFYSVPSDFLYNLVVKPVFGPHVVKHTTNLAQIGTDKYIAQHSTSILYNLVNFYVVIVVLLLFLLILSFVIDKLEDYLCKCLQRPLRHLKNKVVWNSLIRFSIETYYPVCISMFIGISTIGGSTDIERMNFVLAATFLCYLLVLPYGMYRFLRLYRAVLPNGQTKDAYHALYAGVDYFKIQALSFQMLQLYRKFIMIMLVVFLQSLSAIQIHFIVILQLVILTYVLAA